MTIYFVYILILSFVFYTIRRKKIRFFKRLTLSVNDSIVQPLQSSNLAYHKILTSHFAVQTKLHLKNSSSTLDKRHQSRSTIKIIRLERIYQDLVIQIDVRQTTIERDRECERLFIIRIVPLTRETIPREIPFLSETIDSIHDRPVPPHRWRLDRETAGTIKRN